MWVCMSCVCVGVHETHAMILELPAELPAGLPADAARTESSLLVDGPKWLDSTARIACIQTPATTLIRPATAS